MAGPAIELVGDVELRKQLKDMRTTVAKRVMRKAIRKGLKIIQTIAKTKAPGTTIAKLLKVSVRTGREGIIGAVEVKPSERTVSFEGREIGFEFVANVLEFGSTKMNIREQRFLRGAREQGGPAALAMITQEAGKQLEVEWLKLGKDIF